MKVWAIFSIANNYDQPDNNLERLYKNKPTFEQLLNLFYEGRPIGDLEEHQIIGLVGMMQGKEATIIDVNYRIEEVEVYE